MEVFQTSWIALQAEAANYPWGVQLWMRVMAASFAIGIIFAPWKNGARWIVAALAINMIGLVVTKAIFPDLSRTTIGTTIHLVFWSFALFMIWQQDARDAFKAQPLSNFNRIYFVWLVWASVIMAASLFLDAIMPARSSKFPEIFASSSSFPSIP